MPKQIYIAIAPTLFDEIQFGNHIEKLAQQAEVKRWEGPGHPTREAVLAALEEAEVLITCWGSPSLVEPLQDWTPERSPLRLVGHTAGSIKHLMPPEAMRRGLKVVHSNDSLAEAVAEFTIGAILAMRRQMFMAVAQYRSGLKVQGFTQMHELPGSTVGIIGASAIGRRVMDLLRPWRARILLYDPYVSAEAAAGYQAQLCSLETLMQESDIVSLHAPVTDETLKMLREEHFRMMKPGALFVNTARGRLVDQDGLLRVLQTGSISALLDVTDPTEPLPAGSPFFDLPNCVVLPHIAGHSVEARIRQGQYVADDVLRYLRGEPLQYAVQVEGWNQIA